MASVIRDRVATAPATGDHRCRNDNLPLARRVQVALAAGSRGDVALAELDLARVVLVVVVLVVEVAGDDWAQADTAQASVLSPG